MACVLHPERAGTAGNGGKFWRRIARCGIWWVPARPFSPGIVPRSAHWPPGGRQYGLARSIFTVGGSFAAVHWARCAAAVIIALWQRNVALVCAGRAAGDRGAGADQPLVCS